MLYITQPRAHKAAILTPETTTRTSFLDIISRHLSLNGYTHTRIDGTMRAPQRDAALSSLENDAECKIMLASLAVCSVGLNLVAASTVVLADSWWAPAIEDQAVDRVQ